VMNKKIEEEILMNEQNITEEMIWPIILI